MIQVKPRIHLALLHKATGQSCIRVSSNMLIQGIEQLYHQSKDKMYAAKRRPHAAQKNYQNKKFLTQVGFEPTPEDQYLKLAP
jgi:hypothetical protein